LPYTFGIEPKQDAPLEGDVDINPLKPKLILNSIKNSVPASEKTQCVSITKISWMMLFKEIIIVYSKNHMELINALCEQSAGLFIVKESGT
jgi:hypothetical protein